MKTFRQQSESNSSVCSHASRWGIALGLWLAVTPAFGQVAKTDAVEEPSTAVVRSLTTLPASGNDANARQLVGRVTSVRSSTTTESKVSTVVSPKRIRPPGMRQEKTAVGSLPLPPANAAKARPARVAENNAALRLTVSGLPPLPSGSESRNNNREPSRPSVRPAVAWKSQGEFGAGAFPTSPRSRTSPTLRTAEPSLVQTASGEQLLWQSRAAEARATAAQPSVRQIPARTVSGPNRTTTNGGNGIASQARRSILSPNSGSMTAQPTTRIAQNGDGLQILPDELLQSAPSGRSSTTTPRTAPTPASEILPDSVNEAINSRYEGSLNQGSLNRSAAEQVPAPAGSPNVGGRSGTQSNALDALPSDMLLGEGAGGRARSSDVDALIPGASQSAGQSPLSSTNQVIPEASLLNRGPAPSGADRQGQTNGAAGKKTLKAPKYSGLPEYINAFGEISGPHVDVLSKQVPYEPGAFLPSPMAPKPFNPAEELDVYRGKFQVPVQRPLVEWWRPLFGSGIYEPAKNWFGRYNLVMPHFMVYGDFRTAGGFHDLSSGDFNSVAMRANLDMDLELTATERIHAFMGPLDRGGEFTHLDFTNGVDFVSRTDMRLDTLFFEGDAGAIWGGLTDQDAPFDLPFSLGLIPFFYQNGIWAADAAVGAAVALPARHSKLLNWSNYDATFFWASDQVNTDAFPGDNNAAEFFGTAWFIEAYDGYFEVDYAFVHDDVGEHRSYHNFSVGFTKRYFHRISNSIRLITNFDQALPRDQRTAEGHLLLIENALITSAPNTFVPYANFFYGQGRVQSLARAGAAGGILNNTGINFESDGLTGYPTLDASGTNTVGGAVGINLLGHNFNQQLMLEVAGLSANGSSQFRNAPGDQYAVGMRYQRPITNAWIFRTDHMMGFLRNAEDIRGSRVELRFKF